MHWSLGRNESPLANDQARRGYNICTQALEFCVRRLPLANGQEISGLQHVELCTGDYVGKTPNLLMVRREVVCNFCTHALLIG